MKKYIALLLIGTICSIQLPAQLINIREEKPNSTGLHFIKKIVYQPLPGTEKPDKSKPSTTTYKTNQIIEYKEDGHMMSVMDYERGSEDITNSTKRYYWDGDKLVKEVQENAASDVVYYTVYTYNSNGNEIKSVTKSGPADQMRFVGNESIESIWTDGKLTKIIRRDENNIFQSSRTYTYDNKGMLIKEEYTDKRNLTSVKTFGYDAKGNKIKEADLDREGKPKYSWDRVYDAAGRLVKVTGTEYYQGKVTGLRITTSTYDSHGGLASETDTDNGVTNTYTWKNTYDAKGNLTQTVSIKNGKVEEVEVRSLIYYNKAN